MKEHGTRDGAGLRAAQFGVRSNTEEIGKALHQWVMGIKQTGPRQAERSCIQQESIVIGVVCRGRNEVRGEHGILPAIGRGPPWALAVSARKAT